MKTYLGIELGSTRIKGVLIDENHAPVASGGCDWENRLEDGIWTYHLDDVWAGLRECCRTLMEDYGRKFGGPPEMIAGLGVSAMMHGYLVFDSRGSQLVPFRTWRNTTTGQACALLTQKLGFNISQRWSAAHLYQAILNGE
ncbi:MAG: ATPase, partial [Lachnospiraceae bacterium]|nr:ATPase [Lachnospiraceae bacterium]